MTAYQQAVTELAQAKQALADFDASDVTLREWFSGVQDLRRRIRAAQREVDAFERNTAPEDLA